MYDAVNGKFSPVADRQLIKNNSYTYTVQHGVAADYSFYVTAMSKTVSESQPGDTVTVSVPSFDLPTPVIAKAIPDGNKGLIQWQYPAIADIKGFRLYRNDALIADETVLRKGIKEFITPDLEPNVQQSFTLTAITEKGITSQPSAPMLLTIIPVIKKAADYR